MYVLQMQSTPSVVIALLGFTQQSYCRDAGVRPLRFLGKRCMDPDEILWEAIYPPFLWAFFPKYFIFNLSDIFVPLTDDSMGAKISKRCISTSFRPI